MSCIVMMGKQVAKMFSTLSLWGSLFLMWTDCTKFSSGGKVLDTGYADIGAISHDTFSFLVYSHGQKLCNFNWWIFCGAPRGRGQSLVMVQCCQGSTKTVWFFGRDIFSSYWVLTRTTPLPLQISFKKKRSIVGLRYNQLPIYKVDLPPTTILQ